MKTFVSSLLLLGISMASGESLVRAVEPPPSLRKGKVLILKNEYTIEGDIERVGDNYCVRRKLAETWVPAGRVLALVASLPDAYTYLRGRINLGDPDERLRLARWCRDNGLQKQALAELQAAAELRPSHLETRRLLQYWQQASAKETTAPTHDGRTRNTTKITPRAEATPIEVTTESLGLFASRVQPILMNTCARCHATGHGGNFQLKQVFDDNINNRRTLEHNLAAVLAELDVNQPETSRLLIKAVSDHAHTGQAPLHDRQSAPYRTMENWVKRTIADNPQLRDRAGAVATALVPPQSMGTKDSAKSSSEEQRSKGSEESQWGAEGRPSAIPTAVSRGDKGKAAPPPPQASGTSGTPVDPYDPEPFNRKMHPEADKPQPGK